jgi:hypothetical protein
VLKFVSDLQQVGGFLPGTPVSSTNKTVSHNITDILLKVALSTIKPNQSINLAKWFSRRFSSISQSQTRTVYGSHINYMISMKYENFAQDLSYYHSYKVTIRCASWFQRRRFFNFSQSETRISHGDHVI